MGSGRLVYDPSGAFGTSGGLATADFESLFPRLLAARDAVSDDVVLRGSGGLVPPELEPLDAGFLELPERLLFDLQQRAEKSEVARINGAAARLCQLVDRVVVVGIGGSYMGARALFEALCRPYHNEHPRASRHHRPRMYFDGHNLDNDPLQDLVELLNMDQPATTLDERWAIIVVSKSGNTLEPAVVFRKLLGKLRTACGNDAATLRRLVVPVTGAKGRLRDIAVTLGCEDVFDIPEGVGGRYSVLSAVGLLPASVLGIDIVTLLEGAADMNRQFRELPPGQNAVLDYVAVCHLMEVLRGATCRVLSMWGRQLEAVGLWYDQLLSESLGKDGRGATPITVVNTRDLHSRGQQHQDGRRDKMITNVIVDRVRLQAEPVGSRLDDLGQPDDLAGRTLPELMQVATSGTNLAYNKDGRPTADIHLPVLDAYSLGQLFQMLMIATAVEGRLIGVNPYGQPGVEAYKGEMQRILREKGRIGDAARAQRDGSRRPG